MKILIVPIGALALLAGCKQKSEDVSPQVTATAQDDTMVMPPEVGDEMAPDAGGTADAQAEGGIPQALRGRWGLAAGDCTSTRGDAKGLIEVTPEGITFYESRAELASVKTSDSRSLRATFAFSGEGQTWSRELELSAAEDDRSLVRREFGEGAMAKPLTYTKCQ